MDYNNPEKHCEVHKWKEIYAPRFGGDAYTAQQKTAYAENYMKAVELLDKGLLKCSCNNSVFKPMFDKARKSYEDAKAKIEKLKTEHPDILFQN